MGDGMGTETEAPEARSENGAIQQPPGDSVAWRTLAIVAIAAASAGIAFAVIRFALQRPPSDPTTERIQSLVEEANRLLKQLDDQKRG
jgi:hypothetical protein